MFEKHFTAHGLEKLVDYQVGVKKRTLFILEEIVLKHGKPVCFCVGTILCSKVGVQRSSSTP